MTHDEWEKAKALYRVADKAVRELRDHFRHIPNRGEEAVQMSIVSMLLDYVRYRRI